MLKRKYYDRDRSKYLIYSDAGHYIKKEYHEGLLITDVINKSDIPFPRYKETAKKIKVIKPGGVL